MKKTKAHIIVIDDQEDILFASRMLLKKHFTTVSTLSEPKSIIKLLIEEPIDVILLDMNYRIGFETGREGIHLLKEIKKLAPSTVVVFMTAFGKVETAVQGLKLGAFDYILKPWDNDKLLAVLKEAVKERRKLIKDSGKKAVASSSMFMGSSPGIKNVYALADKVAKTDAKVLILGENGTGKSLLAKYIHNASKRNEEAFVHVDLGSLNENIFESELFGYAKGAFTDAKEDTPGRFEAAQGGTIFLDEIGNLPVHLQSKLLQVIQDKTVTRLGETKSRPIDVRIIAATNQDLGQAIQNKNFREDLYYRINTLEITIPPLRQRIEDLLPLAEFLLSKMAGKYEREVLHFEEKARGKIKNYPWHGNVRELENKIERAVILCDSEVITLSDLDLLGEVTVIPEPKALELNDVERITIKRALKKHHYNISRTAEELGLSRAALYRRIEKYEIDY